MWLRFLICGIFHTYFCICDDIETGSHWPGLSGQVRHAADDDDGAQKPMRSIDIPSRQIN